jgi:RNA 2',3'-cyclic 3'-phosphodiesterase
MSERVRAFVAVPRDRMWIESAQGLLGRLREKLPDASWTKPQSWHLTIKFLGSVPRASLEPLASAIAPVARETVPGDLLAGGPAIFPPRGPARVLGVGFAPSPALESLSRFAREVDARAKTFGIEEEKRAFHPHVTLARLRHPWPSDAVATFRAEVEAWPFPDWPVRSCVLYESRLDRSGAIHTPLAEWTFAGGLQGVRA